MSELTVDPYDITVKSNGLRRRRIVEKVFGVLAIGSAVVACGILVLVLGTLVVKGFGSLNLDFFTKARPLFGEKGGVADALVGSALIVGMAMLMAIPVAVFVLALYALFHLLFPGRDPLHAWLLTGTLVVLGLACGLPAQAETNLHYYAQEGNKAGVEK